MQIYLVPRCSIISVVSVDLPLLPNASEAAFLSNTDPAMQPKTVGLPLRSPLAAACRAQVVKTATLATGTANFREMTCRQKLENVIGINDMLCIHINYGCYEIMAACYLPDNISPCPPQRRRDPKLLTVLTVIMFSNMIIVFHKKVSIISTK